MSEIGRLPIGWAGTWARKVKKWRRWAAEMEGEGVAIVIFRKDLDVPPTPPTS